MKFLLPKSSAVFFSALALGFIAVPQSVVRVSLPLEAAVVSPWDHVVADLRDFRDQEVRVAGFRLSKDATVRINAYGGGDRSSWRGFTEDEEPQLYAAGWIIDAESRDVVWEMTFQNSSGRADRRTFDGDVRLSRGAYEVYFSAHGYDHRGSFSNFSMNIDRRKSGRNSSNFGEGILKMFGVGSEDWYEDFMQMAKEWGITLSVPDGDAGSVTNFEAPLPNRRAVFMAYNLGDKEYLRKSITVTKDVAIEIDALGEGRRNDGMFDYGWIVRSDTRQRVWVMDFRSTEYAGGATKNRRYKDELTLARGSYELLYVTDDSHSSEDWNSKPPFDPFRYGIAVSVRNESDRNTITISEPEPIDKNVIVSLVKVRDNDYLSMGFSLKRESMIRVYAIGEQVDRDDPADYGWIVNAKTRERVWTMERRRLEHAGGAQKNKMVDEIITLPAGNYIVNYQTDGSHAYNEWNSDPPYDEEHWGITVMGVGDRFEAGSVEKFAEEAETDIISQIIKVGDSDKIRRRFTISQPTTVRVYALGEGQDRTMYDWGWIEDAKTGRIVWEMTYRMTEHAGGARKNRMVSQTVTLQSGEYELHYESDGSHSFNDWNDDPPEDRTHWGITVYREK
ncbi:MAG: hypothetical protein L0Y80_06320 [Ignavibacteriae bacterium]|nr:hypothetical protein [Ignavibacteriota bacterium]